jgi:hypothetical protein
LASLDDIDRISGGDNDNIRRIAILAHELTHSFQVELSTLGTPLWLTCYLMASAGLWISGEDAYGGIEAEKSGYAMEWTVIQILRNYPHLANAIDDGSVYTDPQYQDIRKEIRDMYVDERSRR